MSGDGVYVIARRVMNHRFHISTRCTSKEAAMIHLRRFQANPGAYSPVGDSLPDDVVLTAKMIDDHFTWNLTHITRERAVTYRLYLKKWMVHFRGRDLRRMQLVADFKSHLVDKKAAGHRIRALRNLYRWLIEERGLIDASQNPTVALRPPRIKPSQYTKQVYVEWERAQQVIENMRPHARDAFILMAGTGMHMTEVRRFAESGTLRPRRDNDPPNVIGVLAVAQHKTGRIHVVNIVHQLLYDAAARVKASGHVLGVSRNRVLLDEAFQKARAKNKQLERFTPRQLRHSVVTWLAQSGMDPRLAGTYVGHTNEHITRLHYLDFFAGAVTIQPGSLRVLDGGK